MDSDQVLSHKCNTVEIRTTFALALLACASPLSSCQRGNSPVEANASDLIFYETRIVHTDVKSRTPILDKFIPQPFQTLAFSRRELLGSETNSRLPETPFAAQQLDVTYGPTLQTIGLPALSHQQEVLLFARDPTETYGDLSGVLDPSTFRSITNPINLPASLAFEIPAVAGQAAPSTVSDITDADFWTGTVGGPGAAACASTTQHGTQCGSIKAARVMQHGFCSAEIPFFDPAVDAAGGLTLFGSNGRPGGSIADQIWNTFFSTANTQSACVHTFRDWIQLGSFLRTTIDNEESQLGGFVLNMGLHDNDFHPGTKDDYVRINETFWLRLKDGRLSAEAKLNGTYSTGTEGDSLLNGLVLGLNTAVGDALFKASNAAQVLWSHSVLKDACTMKSATDTSVSTPVPAPTALTIAPGTCSDFLNIFVQQVELTKQFLSLSSTEQAFVVSNLLHATNGNYDNIECRQPNSAADSECAYVVRAKRVNVMPDRIELVFLDAENDATASAYPVWLLANSRGVASEQLCVRQPLTAPNPAAIQFKRAFVQQDVGTADHAASCEGGLNTCALECGL